MTSPLPPVWRDYLTRVAVLLTALVGLVIGLGGAGAALAELPGGDAVLHVVAAAWITGSVGSLVWFGAFRCPSCGGHFHWTLWVVNPVSNACLHCGFRKWRDPDAARALSRR